MVNFEATKAITKDRFFTLALPKNVKSLAKRLAKEKNIFEYEFLSEQIFLMMGEGVKVKRRMNYNFLVHISCICLDSMTHAWH